MKLRAFGIQPEEFRNYKIGVRHAFRRSPNKHLIGSKPVRTDAARVIDIR